METDVGSAGSISYEAEYQRRREALQLAIAARPPDTSLIDLAKEIEDYLFTPINRAMIGHPVPAPIESPA